MQLIIELPVLFNTNESVQLEELQVGSYIEYAEERVMTFLDISAFAPYKENNYDLSVVQSNGIEYICMLPYQKVKKMIFAKIQRQNEQKRTEESADHD